MRLVAALAVVLAVAAGVSKHSTVLSYNVIAMQRSRRATGTTLGR